MPGASGTQLVGPPSSGCCGPSGGRADRRAECLALVTLGSGSLAGGREGTTNAPTPPQGSLSPPSRRKPNPQDPGGLSRGKRDSPLMADGCSFGQNFISISIYTKLIGMFQEKPTKEELRQ